LDFDFHGSLTSPLKSSGTDQVFKDLFRFPDRIDGEKLELMNRILEDWLLMGDECEGEKKGKVII
jgi:hypothetical protein